MTRGTLRVYLGAAPGVGKTFAMLNEARRRRDRGTDVAIALVETHGRPHTVEAIGDLELIPRRHLEHRGAAFEEMDVDAVLARRPKLAIVDELAHTNVPGSRNPKRWQDVEELLDAGIDVITTVNIQHLESVNDVVERITGIAQAETVPDAVVRQADQVELVDMTPEALRRRLAHGNVYKADKVDAALSNYFRAGNLAALRELALLWVADQVEIGLDAYRDRHDITEGWETRERIVVALTGAPGTEALIRRASRIARRAHGELIGLHVRRVDGLTSADAQPIDDHRRLLEELGGRYHETAGSDVSAALVEFARAENATQLVLGATQQPRHKELLRGSIVNRVLRLSGSIDVHVISQHADDPGRALLPRRRMRPPPALSRRRRAIGWAVLGLALPALTAVLVSQREDVSLSTTLLLYLLIVVISAALGGLAVSLVGAATAFLLANWYFTPPVHTWTVAEAENLIALGVFLVSASIVGALVAVSARRTAEATRADVEVRTLATMVSSIIEPDPLPVLLEHLCEAFALDGAAVLQHDGDRWSTISAHGTVDAEPASASTQHALDERTVLAMWGEHLDHVDRFVLNAFATNLAAAMQRREITARADQARALADADRMRSSLLQAVTHDLRTPLAGIKASASSLRQRDVRWPPEMIEEFATTIEDQTDRLTGLVDNLLDMSRIQAGAVGAVIVAVSVDEIVDGALAGLGPRGREVRVAAEDRLPLVLGDAALLERVVANLVDNALTYAGAAGPISVEAGQVAGRVLVRVVDHGPGIDRGVRGSVFEPFQRQDDETPRLGAGVGLGLAVARGFARACGAELSIDDTPGGGTTMVLDLEVAR